jgi:hypothetical protein
MKINYPKKHLEYIYVVSTYAQRKDTYGEYCLGWLVKNVKPPTSNGHSNQEAYIFANGSELILERYDRLLKMYGLSWESDAVIKYYEDGKIAPLCSDNSAGIGGSIYDIEQYVFRSPDVQYRGR